MISKRELASRCTVAGAAILLLTLALACGGQERTEDDAASGDRAAAAMEEQLAGAPKGGDPRVKKPVTGVGLEPKTKRRTAIDAGGDPIDLPDGYPADIPLFPRAEPTRYVSSPVTGMMTQLRVAEPASSVRSFYMRELASEGWTIKSDETIEVLTFVSAEKDGRDLIVTIEDKGGESHIVLVSEGS